MVKKVETGGDKWRQVETSGDKSRQVETSGDRWRQVETGGDRWRVIVRNSLRNSRTIRKPTATTFDSNATLWEVIATPGWPRYQFYDTDTKYDPDTYYDPKTYAGHRSYAL